MATVTHRQATAGSGLPALVAPSALEFRPRSLRLGELVGRVLVVAGFPPRVGPGWLARLAALPGVYLSIHLLPSDPEALVRAVNRTVSDALARLAQGGSALVRQRAEQTAKDAEELLKKLDAEQQQVFRFVAVLLVLAADEEELARRTRQVQAAAAAAQLRVREALFAQSEGLLAAGPWGLCPDDIRDMARHMPAETCAAAYPWPGGGLNDGQGIVLGRDKDGGLVLLDLWARSGDRTNSNAIILARPGAGKSFTAKLLLIREWILGTQVIVLDPEREYLALARETGGDWIDAGGGGGRINPLQALPVRRVAGDDEEAHGSPLIQHVQGLETFFSLYLPTLTDDERAVLRQALLDLYAVRGIGPDAEPADVPPERWPHVGDLWEHVRQAEHSRLASLLYDAARGADAALWAGPTTIRAGSDFTVLDIHALQSASERTRRAQYYNVLRWAWSQVEARQGRKLLVVDEAWLLADPQTPQSLAFLRDVSKRIRKRDGGLIVISQNVVDFLHPEVSRFGQALLDNPSYKLLLSQGPRDLQALSDLLQLSHAEQELLASARRGEGLLFAGSRRVWVRIEASQEEAALFSQGGGR